MSKERDYFLGLPSSDLQSMRLVEATYAHATAMSRALLSKLPSTDGGRLLDHPAACEFWTAHSDRAFVVSMAALIPELDGAWLDGVGR